MNLLDTRVKAFLKEVEARARERASAFEWATGRLNLTAEDIIPSVSAGERDALERLAKQAQSYGPHALDVLKNGTIGSINWGEGNDEMMRELRIPQLVTKFHLQGRVTGMVAGHVYLPEDSFSWRIQRLGGYIEPLRDPDDVDYEWGIYQALPTHLDGTGHERWRVRIYDLEAKALYEWENLRNAYEIGDTPEPRTDVKMPRYAILNEDVDGLPYGEFMAALPLLRGELAAQMRSDRAAEATASPQLVIKGEAQGYEQRGPTRVILLDENGDARYLTPGDLESLHASHDRKLDRLRLFLNLPGGVSGAQTPSGAALQEMNIKYTASCTTHAEVLSDIMSDLVEDYFDAAQVKGEAPRVAVNVNRAYLQAQITENVVLLNDKGLMDKPSAVRILSQFYREWDDDTVEKFIASFSGGQKPVNADVPEPTGQAETLTERLEPQAQTPNQPRAPMPLNREPRRS